MSTVALAVADLHVTEGDVPILKGVSLTAREGAILGIVGPNGSGKSTLLQAAAGLRGDPAAVTVKGTPLATLSQRERAARIVYVGDDCAAEFALTAEETVLIGSFALGARHADRALIQNVHRRMRETGCFDVRRRYLDQLSGGERQRVALARALVQGAKILCLDESFSKLDVHHQVRMGKLLRHLADRGYAVVLVSHDLNFTAEWSDEVLLLADGRSIAQGPTASTLDEANLLRLYPDAKIEIDRQRAAPRIYFTSSGE